MSGREDIKENIEFEIEPEEISLSSFKVKDSLENHIWNEDGSLDLSVRRSLLDISDDFWESCNIRWVKPKTVLLTGSICNFNWSEFSDVDVHVVVDFSEIHENNEFVQEYFDEKKNDWNNTHENLNVYGFPVEMYVEDIDAETASSAIYDLWENKWLKKPKEGNIEPIKLNKYGIKQVASDLMTQVDDLCDIFEKEHDKHKLEEIHDEADRISKLFKDIRKVGLKKGESGSGNIVYKVARRMGYLDKLWKLKTDCYDRINSINKSDTFNQKIKKVYD